MHNKECNNRFHEVNAYLLFFKCPHSIPMIHICFFPQVELVKTC